MRSPRSAQPKSVVANREELNNAMTPASPPERSWTFAVVDMAGYTALTEIHGDEQAADLATQFVHLAESLLADGDRIIKTMGDAVLVASDDPASSLRLVESLVRECQRLDGFPVARAGLHHGPAVERDGDLFGTAVNTTARVAALAKGRQVLATQAVADTAEALGHRVHPVGDMPLRNLLEPVPVFSIVFPNATIIDAVDPVCRMSLRRDDAAARIRHADHSYWFCSLGCAERFAHEPERFTQVS